MSDQCPKCGAPRTPGPECGQCGVIYAKAEQQDYEQRKERARAASSKLSTTKEDRGSLLKPCPACGNEVSTTAPSCPRCGQPLLAAQPAANNTAQAIGISGSIVLGLGAFAPAVSVPLLGTINFIKNGQGDGMIFLILAATATVVSAMKQYRPLLWIGCAAALLIAYDLYDALYRMHQIKSQASMDLAGNPFRGIGEAMAQSVQLQWGWAVVIAGAGAIIASAIIGRRSDKANRYSP